MLWEHSSQCDISVISEMVVHFDCKHSCFIEKHVPIAFILSSRWQDCAESLEIETISCQWHRPSLYRFLNWRNKFEIFQRDSFERVCCALFNQYSGTILCGLMYSAFEMEIMKHRVNSNNLRPRNELLTGIIRTYLIWIILAFAVQSSLV